MADGRGEPAAAPAGPTAVPPVDARGLGAAIDRYVRPDTFPVGIRLARVPQEVPARARRPRRDFGVTWTICQGIAIARRYGWVLAMGGEDLSCPIALVAFGFRPALPYYSEGHLAAGMYNETLEAGARSEAAVPKRDPSEAATLLMGPLDRVDFEPDVVVVYANPAQVMRLVAGALYRRGGSLQATISPRADCAEIINRTVQTGEPQVILPCYGDRVFGLAQDHEMAFAFPWSWAGELVQGLEGTHRGGVRYPIPQYLRYEAQFPDTYEHLKQLWREGEEGKRGDA
ncbi:MAG: DUF169 domain-containing protein [Clostridia bacterium]|nr:DUF169 domain-containing protein [Clostridia bacterium]